MGPSNQLIPAPETAPPSIAQLSPDERARLWARMVDEGDRLIFESFLGRCGDEPAARQAMLAWLDRRDSDSTAAKIRILRGRCATERFHGR